MSGCEIGAITEQSLRKMQKKNPELFKKFQTQIQMLQSNPQLRGQDNSIVLDEEKGDEDLSQEERNARKRSKEEKSAKLCEVIDQSKLFHHYGTMQQTLVKQIILFDELSDKVSDLIKQSQQFRVALQNHDRMNPLLVTNPEFGLEQAAENWQDEVSSHNSNMIQQLPRSSIQTSREKNHRYTSTDLKNLREPDDNERNHFVDIFNSSNVPLTNNGPAG